MYILFTDETNLRASSAVKFFAYGGVFLDMSRLADLHRRIEAIRSHAGYQPGDELKFDTRARPPHVTLDMSTEAKNQVLTAAAALNCRFIACITHHEIAKTKSEHDLVTYGANTVISGFHRFLSNVDDQGICIVDRFSNSTEYKYLAEKFSTGLTFQDGRSLRLDRIPLFAASCIGASHGAALVDVVLGAFRYCINTPKNHSAAKKMMATLAQVLWSRDGRFLEHGIVLRPTKLRHSPYKAEYDALVEQLRSLVPASTAT